MKEKLSVLKILFWISAWIFISSFSKSFALPRFAVMYNDKCSSCHFNPTGGELRTEDGFEFGKNIMSMISPKDETFPLSNKLTNNISFGLDYRSQYLYAQDKRRSDFQDMEGSIYLNAALSEKINLQSRYDFINNIWEGYAVAKILPNDSYIKVGSFMPNFGIRLDDHTAYTRGGDYGLLFTTGAIQGLIYNPLYTENGIEVGANLSDIIFLTGSVGRAKSNPILTTDPTWTTRLEITPSVGRVGLSFGGSFASTKTKNYNSVTGAIGVLPSQFYGGFAGIGYKQFSLLGEYDLANDYLNSGKTSSALMIEAAYQLMVGLQAVFRYDRFDPNTSVTSDTFSHLIFGFEFYPYSFVEIKPQFRINMHDPNDKSNAVVVQFHFWY